MFKNWCHSFNIDMSFVSHLFVFCMCHLFESDSSFVYVIRLTLMCHLFNTDVWLLDTDVWFVWNLFFRELVFWFWTYFNVIGFDLIKSYYSFILVLRSGSTVHVFDHIAIVIQGFNYEIWSTVFRLQLTIFALTT